MVSADFCSGMPRRHSSPALFASSHLGVGKGTACTTGFLASFLGERITRGWHVLKSNFVVDGSCPGEYACAGEYSPDSCEPVRGGVKAVKGGVKALLENREGPTDLRWFLRGEACRLTVGAVGDTVRLTAVAVGVVRWACDPCRTGPAVDTCLLLDRGVIGAAAGIGTLTEHPRDGRLLSPRGDKGTKVG
mmetsp:Transcript_128886/g.228082  ORF Transcript_128886/g.228082 Transcript_128886/m.228082 type:complete len:190 (-) Transcript_128886:172-741(-)